MGSIPGGRIKIPHVMWHGQNNNNEESDFALDTPRLIFTHLFLFLLISVPLPVLKTVPLSNLMCKVRIGYIIQVHPHTDLCNIY